MNTNTDPRIQRTQHAIHQTFITLLNEKPFENITVQDILKRTPVNRNTFYKYYSSKEVLAGVVIAEFKSRYAPMLLMRLDNALNLPHFLNAVANRIYEERHTILALLTICTPQLHLKQDVEQMLKKHFIEHAQHHATQSSDDDWQYQAELFASMIMTTMMYHLSRNLPLPTETVFQKWRQIADLMEIE